MEMFQHKDGFATYVDFDIAITESSSQDGGAKLSVAGLGSLGGDLKSGTETASKVKFRIPIEIQRK